MTNSVHPASNKKKLIELYEDFWPVEHEPGSIADQLLTKGRLEGEARGHALGEQQGQIAGEIKLIETLRLILGMASNSDDLSAKSLAELRQISKELQTRFLHRQQ